MISLLQIHLFLWLSWEEGASAPSSSFPFRHLPLHHPSLHASFEANLLVSLEILSASLEVLFVFSEVLYYDFHVLLFNNSIVHPLTVNPPFNDIIGGITVHLLEIFGFDFLKIRSMHFGKPFPPTRPSTVFLVSVTIVRYSNLHHSMSMRRSVSYTRLRVDLTRQRVLSTLCPLLSCFSASSTFVFGVFSSVDAIVCNFLFFFVVVGFGFHLVSCGACSVTIAL